MIVLVGIEGVRRFGMSQKLIRNYQGTQNNVGLILKQSTQRKERFMTKVTADRD